MSLNIEGYMNRHISYIEITEAPADRFEPFAALEEAYEAKTDPEKWARALDCVIDASLRDGNDPNQITESLRLIQRKLCQEARGRVK